MTTSHGKVIYLASWSQRKLGLKLVTMLVWLGVAGVCAAFWWSVIALMRWVGV